MSEESTPFQNPVGLHGVTSANKHDLTYEPLEKLDLSEADFAPAAKNSKPSLAEELKFAESSPPSQISSGEPNLCTNGHFSVAEKCSDSFFLEGPHNESNLSLNPVSGEHGTGTPTRLQNGSVGISKESGKLTDKRPELLQTATENTQLSDGNYYATSSQPVHDTVVSQSVQGPRPDLIPTTAGPHNTVASLAACHDTHGQTTSVQVAGMHPSSVLVQNQNAVSGQDLHEGISHKEESGKFVNETSVLSIQAANLEVPGNTGDSRENLSSDISQPSTISSVASSMSSTVSPKHIVTIPSKEEASCEIDQVDSGISVHSLKSNEQNDATEETGNVSTKSTSCSGVNQKPVGFGDIDDDMNEENIDDELEAYLSGMEITANVHRGAQPDIAGVGKGTEETQGPPAVSKEVPKTLNLTEVNKPSMGVPASNLSDAGLKIATDAGDTTTHSVVRDAVREAPKTEDSVERRQSAESVEKFLAQSIMSPGISTPMEDAGFSRVPGYTPVDSMATLAEELEEPEALKLALEGEQTANVNHSNDKTNKSDVVPRLDELNSQSVDGTKQNESTDNAVEMPAQTLSKSPTGIGARPKDPSQMNKKSRPNSLLGLSTPDISIQRPLVIPSENGTGFEVMVPTQPSSVLSGANPAGATSDITDTQFAQSRGPSLQRDGLTLDIKNQFDTNQFDQRKVDNDQSGFGIMSPEQHMESVYAGHTPHQPHPPPYMPPQSLALPPPGQALVTAGSDPSNVNVNQALLPDEQGDLHGRQKRPTSLSLMPRGEAPPPNARPPLPDDAFQGHLMDSDSSGTYSI